jgi:signal transduction histidine kinase
MDGHSATSDRRLAALHVPRWLPPALAVAAGYYLASRLGFTFTLKPYPISTLWPPNALLAAALLLAPTRSWWWLLLAVLPAHWASQLQSMPTPSGLVIGWYISNCSEALIGAALVRAYVPGPLRFDGLRNAVVFVLGAVLAAPLLSSFVDAAVVRVVGWPDTGYWQIFRTRFFSNILAELTVGPLILTWAALAFADLRGVTRARAIEAAALFGGLLAVCVLVFGMPHGEMLDIGPAMFYIPLPFLLWAAMRFGPAGTASAVTLLTVTTIWGTVHGMGPFAGQPPHETAREMQFYLSAVAVSLLLLAVAVEDRARVQREAQEQRNQLTHLSRVAMLGELSGGIAHELNQPLTAILSNAQAAQHFLANKSAEPGMLAEILQDIIAADQRAGDVIQRLRALFKRGEPRLEPLDANALVHEALSLAQGDFATRGVEVALRLAHQLPEVRGDRVQLQQVLLNLIVNGAEAMASVPQRDRLLTVQTMSTAGRVHINVTDRGTGLPAKPEKLFEAFYTTKPKGLGLGLSISKSIIDLHGGRLWASTRRGGGAAFLITLPALPKG